MRKKSYEGRKYVCVASCNRYVVLVMPYQCSSAGSPTSCGTTEEGGSFSMCFTSKRAECTLERCTNCTILSRTMSYILCGIKSERL